MVSSVAFGMSRPPKSRPDIFWSSGKEWEIPHTFLFQEPPGDLKGLGCRVAPRMAGVEEFSMNSGPGGDRLRINRAE